MSQQLSLSFGDEALQPSPQNEGSRQGETATASARPVEEITRLDQAQEINVAHVAEAINYHPSVNQSPSSSEERLSSAAPPLLRPDRQQTFDGEPVEDWPKPKYDPEAITVDRPHDGMDGPAHRFVIRCEDNVEVFISANEARIGEVLEIGHTSHRVLVKIFYDDDSEEEWFPVERVFPTLERPQ
jgi:hypothetical protein